MMLHIKEALSTVRTWDKLCPDCQAGFVAEQTAGKVIDNVILLFYTSSLLRD